MINLSLKVNEPWNHPDHESDLRLQVNEFLSASTRILFSFQIRYEELSGSWTYSESIFSIDSNLSILKRRWEYFLEVGLQFPISDLATLTDLYQVMYQNERKLMHKWERRKKCARFKQEVFAHFLHFFCLVTSTTSLKWWSLLISSISLLPFHGYDWSDVCTVQNSFSPNLVPLKRK